MLSYFKSQQPSIYAAFIIFFIGIKLPFLFAGKLYPIDNVENLWGETGILLPGIVFLNVFIAQVCLLLQALLFNFLFHKANYHESNTLIPAIYFTLVSSLIPHFNQFSIYIIIGFLLLIMFQVLLLLAIKENCRVECFNLGFLAGILVIINIHFIWFLPFLFIMLYVIKPFRISEYFMLLFGILGVIYLSLGISYLADLTINIGAFTTAKFQFFRFRHEPLTAITFILTACYLLFSFVSMRGIMFSTGFKRRKNIYMLILFLLGTVSVILFSGSLDETVFSLLFIPASVFLALFMLRIRKKRLGEILNAIFVITIFIVSLVRLFT